MRTFLHTLRSAFTGTKSSGGRSEASRRRPFRLAAMVMVATLVGGALAVMGSVTSAYAASTTTTTTTPTTSSIVLGQSDTDGATVTGNPAGGSPTGTVSFYVCGPAPTPTPCTSTADPVGSAVNLTAGPDDTATAGSVSFTPTSTGSWCFAADYSGDPNYGSSTDATTDGCFDVTSASSSTVTAPTGSTITLGEDNTDGATVTGNPAGGSPSGTVSFYVCGPTPTPTPCTSTADPVGSAVNLTAGPDDTATAGSVTFTPTSTGSWCFAADYSGDPNYSSSTDATTDGCFDVTTIASPMITVPASSTITLGEDNTDGATVTGNSTAGSPTGTVSFYACGPTPNPTPCTSTADPVGGAVGLTAGPDDTATAGSVTFTPTAAGTWCFAGYYSGDANYSSSTDTTTDECFDVTAATATLATIPSTSTAALGTAVHDGATVTGNGAGGSPTGSVSFYRCGPTATPSPCTSTADPVGSAVTVTGAAHDTSTATSASFTPTALGYWCFAVAYSGSADYATNSDTATSECVDVTQASSSTTTVPANSSITLGQADTDVATVAGNTAGGSPSGTVTFYQCGPSVTATACTSTADPVGSPVDLTGGSHASSTATSAPFTPTAVGYWCFAASYSGDSNYKASSDTSSGECVNVEGPLTVVTTSLPHGLVNKPYSATLNASGGTGPYTWSHTGPLPKGMGFSKAGVLSGTPTVSGSYSIVFKVADSTKKREYASKSLALVIDLTAVSTSTSATPAHPSVVLGTGNTDGAKVTGDSVGGSPTGTVTFYACGPTPAPTACTSTAHRVGSAVTLVAGSHDTATATSSPFTAATTGYWCFEAVYSGNFNYNSSTDSATAECYDVTPAAPTITSTPASPTIVLGHGDSADATVTGNAAGGSPTGTVSFYQCGPTPTPTPCTSLADPVGTGVTVAPGSRTTATATSSSFVPTSTGYWCFAEEYSGDSNYDAGSDTTTDGCFDVTGARTSTTTAATNATIALGQSDSDLATVTGNAAGGSPTGTVAFYRCGPESVPTACTSTTDKVGGPVNLTPGADNGSSATSATFKPTAVGYWCFAASYSGDANYTTSTDTSVKECVDVTGPPTIATTSLPHGTKGQAYSTTLVARGGTAPYTWSHTGSIPHGMSLSKTGVLSGTPTVSGTFTIVFKVRDSSSPPQYAARSLKLVIAS
jgi:uncharacterized GH25 family protein